MQSIIMHKMILLFISRLQLYSSINQSAINVMLIMLYILMCAQQFLSYTYCKCNASLDIKYSYITAFIHMFSQIFQLLKSLSTMPPIVNIQGAWWSKSHTTDIASVRFLSTVYPHVSGQFALLSKSFLTYIANVRFLPIMRTHVYG